MLVSVMLDHPIRWQVTCLCRGLRREYDARWYVCATLDALVRVR